MVLLFFFLQKKENQLLCREGGLELLLASGRALGGGNAELLAAGGVCGGLRECDG